jgi:D-psicose/D-tagatose/L-ribulose 3-epimerase
MNRWMTKSSLLLIASISLAACGHGSSGPPPTAAPPVAQAAPPALDVKVGRCTDVDKLAETKAAGFDYAELGTRNIAKLSEEELAAALAKHKEVGLPTPVANVFLPNEMKVVGPTIDEPALLAYAEKAFDRMSKFGVQIIVFGSGGARKVPDGFSKDEAFNQLVAFAKKIAPMAQAHGITLAVEPLQTKETNIINSAAEGLKWVKAVDHPNFRLMVDFYHLASEKEDPKILVEARDYIKHFHIANPNKRVFPMNASEYDYAGFFDNLRRMGYHGRISVEAGTKNFTEEGPKALAFLRVMLGQQKEATVGVGNVSQSAPPAAH